MHLSLNPCQLSFAIFDLYFDNLHNYWQIIKCGQLQSNCGKHFWLQLFFGNISASEASANKQSFNFLSSFSWYFFCLLCFVECRVLPVFYHSSNVCNTLTHKYVIEILLVQLKVFDLFLCQNYFFLIFFLCPKFLANYLSQWSYLAS